MLLPIKLATGKQPAKKQKVQKDLGLVITPEMQKNIEATNPQGIVERAKRIEAVRAEQEQFWKGIKQGKAQLAYEQTLKQVAQQPKQAKAFVPKLQELEKQISPPPVSREVVMQKRVPKTPEGLATISILTDYGTASYTATPKETQILEFGTIDEGAALRNRLRQEAQAYAQEQGLKKKRKTADAYVSDTVNAALNPNFVDEQVANTLREQLDDKIFDFAAKYSVGGKLVKTGRDALKSASDKLKNVDDVGAQVTAGLIDSLINPVSSFATATANVYDPTATTEERVGAAGNIGLYALSAIPVTEAVGASVRAFKTGADVAEGLTLAARSLLESTVPGRYISRKTTINDLVNVLERNGQMGGKTRGQLAKEFATGGKEFAKATGQAPELFYNKYLNDLAEKATPTTTTPELPAQFDLTKPQATAINPVIDEALRTADEITSQAPTTENFEFNFPTNSSSEKNPQHWRNALNNPSINAYKKNDILTTVLNTPNFIKELTNDELKFARNLIIKNGIASNKEINALENIDKIINPNNILNKNDYLELIVNQRVTPTTGNSAIDEAFKVEQEIAGQVARPSTIQGVSGVSEELSASSAMQAEQPPVPPTQTATTAIPEAPQEQFTSAKNRMTQEVRDEYDMGKFDEPTRRAWEESLTNAKQKLQSNSNTVDNVIAKVESKQAINETEQSVLVVALSRERQNARRLLEQTDNATTPEEIATLAEQTKIAEDRIDNYTKALNRAGSETARTLNARRAVIDAAEDLVSVRAKARQTYGKTLEAVDEEAINEIGKGLEDINKQIDEATGKGTTPVETTKANTRVKGIKESAPKLQPKTDTKRVKQFETVVNRVKEKLDAFVRPSTIETMGVPTEVDIWQPRLNDPASQAYFKQLASVQNDMGKVIQKLVTDEAIEDFDTLLTRLQADGFNITDTDLKLILSADYPNTKLYDFSDIEKEYVKMVRRQLAQEAKASPVGERSRLIRKVQALQAKVQAGVSKSPDKTVKKVFEENIDLQNRLDDLQAMVDIPVVRKEIEDIEKQIANPVFKEKLEREIPENVRQLLIDRELLRRRKQQLFRKLAAEKDKRDNPSKYAMMNAFKLVNELKFGADASSLFTHGLFNVGTKESALAFKDGISAMFSEKNLSKILSEIKTNPRYQEAVDAGVAGIKERELADSVVYSNVIENIPIVRALYNPGSRFNEAFNTRLRMTMYNDVADLMESRWFGAKGTKDAPTREAIATTVNNMTGAMTGKFSKALNQNEKTREFIGVVLPTIKFLGSRFQLAFGNPALQAAIAKNPALAVYVAKKYARFGALMIGGLYGLDKTLSKDRFKIDNDPTDMKNFGKITDLKTNIVYQPFKNFLEPYKFTANMEVMRDFMADKDENGIPIESSKPEQSFFERDETSAITNRIGTAPRAAYNLLAGVASPSYKSFGKNLSIRTGEGLINTATQFAPIAGIQGAELLTLKEPATQRDVELANKLIGIVLATSGIPTSTKKEKEVNVERPPGTKSK